MEKDRSQKKFNRIDPSLISGTTKASSHLRESPFKRANIETQNSLFIEQQESTPANVRYSQDENDEISIYKTKLKQHLKSNYGQVDYRNSGQYYLGPSASIPTSFVDTQMDKIIKRRHKTNQVPTPRSPETQYGSASVTQERITIPEENNFTDFTPVSQKNVVKVQPQQQYYLPPVLSPVLPPVVQQHYHYNPYESLTPTILEESPSPLKRTKRQLVEHPKLTQRELLQNRQEVTKDLEEVKRKLKVIFIHYASFGDRMNTQNLKSAKFHKMLHDTGISTINKKRIDLIFVQTNKNRQNMSFDVFLSTLIKIAEYLFPSSSSSEALIDLVAQYFLPLYNSLSNDTIPVIRFDPLIDEIFRDLGPMLHQIYFKAFPNEIKGNRSPRDQEDWNISENNLFQFLSQYEISPNLLTKSSILQIFQQAKLGRHIYETTSHIIVRPLIATRRVIADPDRVSGKNFTFAAFLDLLVKCAIQSFSKSKPAESLALLLEKMELSQGFAKNNLRTYTSTTTLLPSKKIVDKIQYVPPPSPKMKKTHLPKQELKLHSVASALNLSQEKRSRSKDIFDENVISYRIDYGQLKQSKTPVQQKNSLFEIILKNSDKLRKVFTIYCQLCDPLNTFSMGSQKFIRMLKDMGIISFRGISTVEADIIFKKISGLNNHKVPYNLKNINERNLQKPVYSSFTTKRNSVNNDSSNLKPKMNFNQFGMALIEISQVMYREKTEKSLNSVIEMFKIPNFETNNNEQILQKHEILESVKKAILPFFLVYADPRSQLLDFDSMVKFCTDFEIFPDILSKAQVIKLFMKQTGSYEKSQMKVNQNQFVETLSRIANEITLEITLMEKIVMLMQKLNNSYGPAKVTMQVGKAKLLHGMNHDPSDLMYFIRKNHPEYLEQKKARLERSFDDIIKGKN